MRAIALFLAAALSAASAFAADDFVSCRGERVSGSAPRLPPCPERPNCSSSASGAALDAPRGEAPRGALARAIRAEPRSAIVFEAPQLLVATFRSALFGFTDEALFVFGPDGRISFRSIACSGYYDFGVNRRRIERIRERLRASR